MLAGLASSGGVSLQLAGGLLLPACSCSPPSILMSSTYKGTSRIRLGPSLVTSFYRPHLLKDPLSRYSHTLRCWGLGHHSGCSSVPSVRPGPSLRTGWMASEAKAGAVVLPSPPSCLEQPHGAWDPSQLPSPPQSMCPGASCLTPRPPEVKCAGEVARSPDRSQDGFPKATVGAAVQEARLGHASGPDGGRGSSGPGMEGI